MNNITRFVAWSNIWLEPTTISSYFQFGFQLISVNEAEKLQTVPTQVHLNSDKEKTNM